MTDLDAFFAGQEASRALFDAVVRAVQAVGSVEMQVSKSQVAFRRARPFAAVWMPEQYLRRKAAPLVLTLYLRRRIESPRWKQVVEPVPGRFTHHLELCAAADVDDEVLTWLKAAWMEAG